MDAITQNTTKDLQAATKRSLAMYSPQNLQFAPENGWLEVGILVSFWEGLFSGVMLVPGSVWKDRIEFSIWYMFHFF